MELTVRIGVNEKESTRPPDHIEPSLDRISGPVEKMDYQEISKKLAQSVHRLRYFQNHCIGWKKGGTSNDSEIIFLDLTITVLEGIIEKWRRLSNSEEHHPLMANIWSHWGVKVVLYRFSIGLLTGFFGVGEGFLVVLTLVFGLGFTPHPAAATALLIITVTSLEGLLGYMPTTGLNVSLGGLLCLGALVGIVSGAKVAPPHSSSHPCQDVRKLNLWPRDCPAMGEPQ